MDSVIPPMQRLDYSTRSVQGHYCRFPGSFRCQVTSSYGIAYTCCEMIANANTFNVSRMGLLPDM